MIKSNEHISLMIIQMVDLECQISKVSIMKAKWVEKYMDPNNKGRWKLFLDFFLGKHDSKLLFTGNLKLDDVTFLQIKEVAECWSRLNFKTQLSNFSQSPIWYNSLIHIDNKPLYYANWASAGISTASHLPFF